jgi:hypothetical protein
MKFTFTFFSLLISCSAYAGLFDSFKDPATLILNQKDCLFSNHPVEIIDGKLIAAGVRVLVILKKLDKNRITYENQNMEPKRTAVLIVERKAGTVQAGLSQDNMFIVCKLR